MRILWASLLALGVGGIGLAQDQKPADSRADRLKALQKEYTEANQKLSKDFQEAKDAEAKAEVRKAGMALAPKYAEKYLALAEEDPKDDVGFDAANMAITMGRGGPVTAKATKLMMTHHVANPKVTRLLPSLARTTTPEAREFLKAVLEKNPDKSAKGQACLALAQAIAAGIENADDKKADELEAQAMAYYERIVKEFGDVNIAPAGAKVERLLGTMAKNEMAGVKNLKLLKPGKPAPEIEGEDVDGAKFKLSDYRGKVVMLDFWGHW
jgi:hypothetical protein